MHDSRKNNPDTKQLVIQLDLLEKREGKAFSIPAQRRAFGSLLVPVESFGYFSPEGGGILNGLFVHSLILCHAADVCYLASLLTRLMRLALGVAREKVHAFLP